MRVLSACLLAMVLIAIQPSSLIGTSYSTLNCAQFACRVTHHKAATAKQLFEEGTPLVGQPHVGDIVCYRGGHVAVMTVNGLMDSVPERGVGYVGTVNKNDGWYFAPIHVVRL